MTTRTETTDWLGTIDWSADPSDYGYLQPGYTAAGTLDTASDVDLIKVPMANGFTYSFTVIGDGVTATMLDDFGDVDFSDGALNFTPSHPSSEFYIEIKGSGSYQVIMDGISADTTRDEDPTGGINPQTPVLAVDETRTGVINGNDTLSDADHYATYLVAGETYRWTMEPVDSVYGPTAGAWLTVLNADGEAQAVSEGWSSAWDDGSYMVFTPTTSGTYYVNAQAYGFNNSGSYRINLRKEEDADQADSIEITKTVLASTKKGGWILKTTVTRSDDDTSDAVTGTLNVVGTDTTPDSDIRNVDKSFTIAAGETTTVVRTFLGGAQKYDDSTGLVVSLDGVTGAAIDRSDGFATVDVDGVTLRGTKKADLLKGSAGDDLLVGRGGRDTLMGRDGDDTLSGLGGNDKLRGGEGDDLLKGGAGRDQFIFSSGDGDDTIQGFQVGMDKIVIRKGASKMNDLSFTPDGDDVLIGYDGGSILVLDTTLAEIEAGSNFIL